MTNIANDIAKFNQLYDVCIDSHGNMRACGREACQRLLECLDKDPKYGDYRVGRLNIDTIIELHNQINGK